MVVQIVNDEDVRQYKIEKQREMPWMLQYSLLSEDI